MSTERPLSLGATLDVALSNEDRAWLQEYYPALKIDLDGGEFVITGCLQFSMAYLKKPGRCVINPSKHYQGGVRLEGAYEIRIERTTSRTSSLPRVSEIGGKLECVAQAKGLQLEGLHVNPNQSLCLCAPPEEEGHFPNGFNLKDFMCGLVIPYFYAQRFFEENDKWPWGQRSHGVCGLIECYPSLKMGEMLAVENFMHQLRAYDSEGWQRIMRWLVKTRFTVKGHYQCVCDSKVKFRNCHRDVFLGLWKLRNDARLFGTKVQ